jgi:hypothetical protein
MICILKVILERKNRQVLLHYVWKLHGPFSNYSVTETKVVEIINFLKERVIVVDGSLH